MAKTNPHTPPVIGLTGGIGSGKSEAARQFALLGITVVDADIVAREVVEPSSQALARIAEHFGQHILRDNGALNRSQLREIIFTEPEQKSWLEDLLHPLINRTIKARLHTAQSPYTLLVSPLLLETQQHLFCDRILVIDCPLDTQIARTTQRDNTHRAQVEAIIKSQMPREQRLAKAQDILHNRGELQALNTQIQALHQQYLNIATKHSSL